MKYPPLISEYYEVYFGKTIVVPGINHISLQSQGKNWVDGYAYETPPNCVGEASSGSEQRYGRIAGPKLPKEKLHRNSDKNLNKNFN